MLLCNAVMLPSEEAKETLIAGINNTLGGRFPDVAQLQRLDHRHRLLLEGKSLFGSIMLDGSSDTGFLKA